MSKEADKLFKEMFGWEVRNGIFTSSTLNYMYGEPYLFFPIGDFKFVWSPDIDDFYDAWQDAQIKFYTLDIHSYIDKYLEKAIKSGNEISFNCKEYYLVDLKMRTFLEDNLFFIFNMALVSAILSIRQIYSFPFSSKIITSSSSLRRKTFFI